MVATAARFAAFALASAAGSSSRERFVVQLVGDPEPGFTSGAPADAVRTSVKGGLVVPKAVSVQVRGFPFHCTLPVKGTKANRDVERRRLSLYAAACRSAALFGRCMKPSEQSAWPVDPEFELCLGDHLRAGGLWASHEAAADELLEHGGFRQSYLGLLSSPGGGRLRATVRCHCRESPLEVLAEPLCRIADVVHAARAGRDGLSLAVATGDEFVDEDGSEFLGVLFVDAGVDSDPVNVLRQDAFTVDGVSCASASGTPSPLASFEDVSSRHEGEMLHYDIGLSAATCCGYRGTTHKAEGAGSNPPLLAPLVGRCVQILIGWWTYEVCYPWRVRLLHLTPTGEVDGKAVTVGYFQGATFAEQPSPDRLEGRKKELVATLNGDLCQERVQKWQLDLGGASFSAVGGVFNPPGVHAMEGVLDHDPENVDGCKAFSKRLDGKIALSKRGNCWFHIKALAAQRAGAIGLIIYNENHHMIQSMEGVDELRSPTIPTLLVDRAAGQALKAGLNKNVRFAKVSPDGVDLAMPVTTTMVFVCSNNWQSRREVCKAGDSVEVKIVDDYGGDKQPRWPDTAVHYHQGVLSDVNYAEETAEVRWEPETTETGEVIEDVWGPTVPLRDVFRDGGVPCWGDPLAFVEQLQEHTCGAEIVVHVAALCADPQLAPEQPPEPQRISCVVEDGARERLFASPRRWRRNAGSELYDEQPEVAEAA